jgi:hypothetical protein
MGTIGKRRNKEEERKEEWKNERNGLTLTGLLMEGTIFRETTPSESKTENDARFVLLSRLASRLQSMFRSARRASRRNRSGT